MLAFVLADLVDRHDPGMIEVGRRLGLDVEPPDVGLVGELAGEDHLERHRPIQADLPGLEHDAHAAAGDLADDLVVAEIAGRGRERSLGRLARRPESLVDRGLVAPCNRCFLVDRGASLTRNGTRRRSAGVIVGTSEVEPGCSRATVAPGCRSSRSMASNSARSAGRARSGTSAR